jgi:hypothetical protein
MIFDLGDSIERLENAGILKFKDPYYVGTFNIEKHRHLLSDKELETMLTFFHASLPHKTPCDDIYCSKSLNIVLKLKGKAIQS